jgi:hypothetical protein
VQVHWFSLHITNRECEREKARERERREARTLSGLRAFVHSPNPGVDPFSHLKRQDYVNHEHRDLSVYLKPLVCPRLERVRFEPVSLSLFFFFFPPLPSLVFCSLRKRTLGGTAPSGPRCRHTSYCSSAAFQPVHACVFVGPTRTHTHINTHACKKRARQRETESYGENYSERPRFRRLVDVRACYGPACCRT